MRRILDDARKFHEQGNIEMRTQAANAWKELAKEEEVRLAPRYLKWDGRDSYKTTLVYHEPGCRYQKYRVNGAPIPLERDTKGHFLQGGHECGGSFVCLKCGRRVGRCFGKGKDDLCKDCWKENTRSV
jgi:hypothetical protein